MLIGITSIHFHSVLCSSDDCLYNIVLKELSFHCLAYSSPSGPVGRWSFDPPYLRDALLTARQLSTAAIQGRPFPLQQLNLFYVFFSATSPASNTLPAETLLTDGWHNILLTGIHWLHNVTINLKYQRLDNTYFYFALVKLTSNHYVTHTTFSKKSMF